MLLLMASFHSIPNNNRLNSLRMKDSLRFDSWDIRTSLSEKEAKEWASEARDSQAKGHNSVFVVLFLDGKLDTVQANEEMEGKGRCPDYNADWYVNVARICSFGEKNMVSVSVFACVSVICA